MAEFRRRARLSGAALAALCAATAAYAGAGATSASASRGSTANATMGASTPRASAANASRLPQGGEVVNLRPADFTTTIDNPYWPMKPGTRWTYRETDGRGGEQTVTVTVTRRTKRMANGVTARVVRDTASGAGRLIEDTFDFYAQDKRGNVWYLGEDTAELEAGRISSRAGSWQVGVNGAQAGIIIPARPRQGMRYREEYLEGQAEDRGQVLATGLAAQAPYGHFRSNLLIADTTPLEPRVLELKFYARTVGPLLTLNASGGAGRAELRSKDIAPPEWVTRAAEAPLGRGPTR